MAETRADLYLRISQNLTPTEVRDLRNHVEGHNLLPARDVQCMNPYEICIKLDHNRTLWEGEPTRLEDLMTKIGRKDFAEEAKKIAAQERQGATSQNMSVDTPNEAIAGPPAKRPRLSATRHVMDMPMKLTLTRQDNNRRKIFISRQAEKIISSLPPCPLDVVAVVGPGRKGKSHLANLLCQRKSGFQLGHELDPETKDFWFWMGPHPVQSGLFQMVIDTEGLGYYANEEVKEKDIKHLVLATLLSNQLVLNLQGNLDQDFLPNLRLMGDLAEHVRVQADGNDGGSNLGDHFPELWVTVNTHLKTPQGKCGRLTPDEYLEVMLEPKSGNSKALSEHNATTDAVKAFFPKRHLRLIPQPSANPDILSMLDEAEDCALESKYKDAVDDFRREVWDSHSVKKINGDYIKTTGLLDIMRYCIKELNDPDAIPSVIGAHEAMVEGECRRDFKENMKQFKDTMEKTVKPLMPTTEENCNRRIESAMESAVSKWDKAGKWKKRIKDQMETERVALLELNSFKSKAICEEIINEEDRSVRRKFGCGVYNTIGGFNAYKEDMEAVCFTYRQKASGKGPAVEEVLNTFFSTTETSRGNSIWNTEQKLVEEAKKTEEADERARVAREEAALTAEAKNHAEAEKAKEVEKRRAAEEEAKRHAAEAEAARQAQRTAEERAIRRRRKRSKIFGIF